MCLSGSTDAFLGGRLSIRQGSYRAGADPVLLAAAVPAASGDSVLDLGCGVGVGLFCLAARVGGLALHGLERDPGAADLARANAAEIVTGDVARVPSPLRDRRFNHVMMNPPFFRDGRLSPDVARSSARHETTPLADWLDAGLRRVRPGGSLTIIQRTDRLTEIIAGLGSRLGALDLRPLAPRAGRDAKLVIVSGRKGARAPLRLRAPFVLHSGDSHLADGDGYAPEASAILRSGAGFPD